MNKKLILIVTALVISLAACLPPLPNLWPTAPPASTQNVPVDPPPYVGSGPRVAALGDSITYVTRDALAAALPDRSTSVLGLSGFTAPWVKPWANKYAADPPPVIVIEVGTNDVGQQIVGKPDYTSALFASRVAAYNAMFPTSCVVWVTTTTHRTAAGFPNHPEYAGQWDVIAAEYNNTLRAQVHVADWDALLVGHPEYVPDDVHPDGPGITAYTNLVASAVRTCP